MRDLLATQLLLLVLLSAAACSYEAWSQDVQPLPPGHGHAAVSSPAVAAPALKPDPSPLESAPAPADSLPAEGPVAAAPVEPVAPLPPPEVVLRAGPIQYRGRSFLVVEAPVLPPAGGVIRYRVAVEAGLEAEATEFTRAVERVLGDPSGWASAGTPLVRVDADEDITVLLGEPRTIDKLCAPMNTGGALSCALQRQANINAVRFRTGSWTWAEDIVGYRSYLINHEVGHLLGMRHEDCPHPGAPAPVMMQQTIRLGRCAPNGHPTPPELDRVIKQSRSRDARWTRLKTAEARWRRGRGPAPDVDPR